MTDASVWYPIDRCWSGEGGCRVTDGPDRRCCPACGASPEAAVREVQVTVQAWLASACEHGAPIPEPRYRTTIYSVQAPAKKGQKGRCPLCGKARVDGKRC